MIHVDAQDLAEQLIDVLRVVRRVVAGASVADADVQIAVDAEGQHAAVVIRVRRMRDRQQHLLAGGIGHIPVGA
jgi:hypothetical protein